MKVRAAVGLVCEIKERMLWTFSMWSIGIRFKRIGNNTESSVNDIDNRYTATLGIYRILLACMHAMRSKNL